MLLQVLEKTLKLCITEKVTAVEGLWNKKILVGY